jgi:hypothetical protein
VFLIDLHQYLHERGQNLYLPVTTVIRELYPSLLRLGLLILCFLLFFDFLFFTFYFLFATSPLTVLLLLLLLLQLLFPSFTSSCSSSPTILLFLHFLLQFSSPPVLPALWFPSCSFLLPLKAHYDAGPPKHKVTMQSRNMWRHPPWRIQTNFLERHSCCGQRCCFVSHRNYAARAAEENNVSVKVRFR